MNLLVEAVVRINRLFPRPNVGGRESDEAYSQWEYDVGRQVFLEHFGAQLLQGARMLDVGCGMGGKTVWYAESGAASVFGIDLEMRHAAQSARFAASRKVADRVHIAVGDAMRMPFADGEFTVVTANDSMEHFADPAAALRELGRVLKPGGRLYIYFTPYRSPLGSHLYDHVKIPWCQIVLPRKVLYATLERAVLDEERAKGGDDADARAERRYREIVEYFENCVNGITVGRFHEILAAEPTLRPRKIHYVVPKFGFLRPLTHVPGLREYFAGLVFADLERV
ncbi:MAG: class I SAM-dependent methyltransferase [Candidatus Krumholzibacteriia bacterium]